jgi:hypothetical protein
MRQLLSNGAMIFAGMVSVPAIVTTVDAQLPQKPSLPAVAFKADPRLPLLERFFEIADAPAKAFSHLFLSEADHYALDWRLLPSISFVETTGGKAARNNNLFGWDCGRAEFPSMSAGIHTVAYNLANSRQYKDKGLDELLWAYNPNPEYSRKVKSVMSRIAPSEIPAE